MDLKRKLFQSEESSKILLHFSMIERHLAHNAYHLPALLCRSWGGLVHADKMILVFHTGIQGGVETEGHDQGAHIFANVRIVNEF